MASDDELPSLARVVRAEDPQVALRSDVAAKAKRLNEAIEDRHKAEIALASAQAAYDEACRDVAMRESQWEDALAALLAAREER